MAEKSELVGQWRLVSFVEFDEQGDPMQSPVGAEPRGSLRYGRDGYMSVHIMRTDGEPAPATAYIGYTGTWRLAGDQVVHTVEIAADPSWAGTEQVRDVSLSGDRLVLGRTDTVNGRPLRAELDWRRSD